MFTLEQIKQALSKVKSGIDFPAYIREIKSLGVISYETFVSDGHTDFFGVNGYKATTTAKYNTLTISPTSNASHFKIHLKAHQQGKTDYLTFCDNCAESGIEKWVVCMDKMTCTYYDKIKNEILVEQIPK
jgi:uncharacterized protein YbcV (DUF1398 family)